MSIGKTNSAQPVHWSKDFVEHLRTVHSTLMAVSVAIIIIVLSAKPYNPGIAARQLHQVMELKKLWSPQWIRVNGERSSVHVSASNTHYFQFKGTSNGFEAIVRRDKTGSFGENSTVCFQFPTDNYFAVKNAPVLSVPGSLSEFEKWWDNLSKVKELEFPSDVNDFFEAEGLKKDDSIAFEVNRDVLKCGAPTIPLKLGFLPIGHSLVYATVQIPDKPKFPGVDIEVGHLEHVEISQANIAKFFGNWKIGGYRYAFFDLSQATKEIESLEFEDIVRILDADATKGEDVFEVLGIKIPLGQVTTWGDLILLGIQVYLLLFLKQLTGKLGAEDPGWDVPWIGMNQTMFARCMLFLTLVLLPCIAVAILGGQSISLMTADFRDPQRWWKLTVSLREGFVLAAKVLLIVAAFSAACVLSAQSWKHRPRLSESEPAPD